MQDRGWVPAGQLRVRDWVHSHDGQWTPVTAVELTGTPARVYNFRIADHHTYFVGDDDWGFSVWVHNSYLKVQKRLAGVTAETRDAFLNDGSLLQRYLREKEIDAIVEEPWRMTLFFGTAVERRVAEIAETDSLLSGLTHHKGNAPVDFTTSSGIGFDITGGSRSSINAHFRRPEVTAVITYDSIALDFGYKWIKEVFGE